MEEAIPTEDGPLLDEVPFDRVSANLRRVVNFVRDLIVLEEKIAELGGLDSAIKEAQVRYERTSVLEIELQERYDRIVDEARAKVKEAEDEARLILNKARNKEAEILHESGVRVETATKAAQDEAIRILDAARAEEEVVGNKIKEGRSRLENIEGAISGAKSELNSLQEQVNVKRDEHKAITDKHEKFLSSIGAK
jgi:hypothetical protein